MTHITNANPELLELSLRDGFYHINMTAGDRGNTLDYAAVAAWNATLDQLPDDVNTALVITSEHAKFFSAGIDLKFIEREGLDKVRQEFIPELDALLKRLATLPMPTLAAINGHAYGGGALLATACDFRLMRSDNGRFCFPEIDVKIVFSDYMQQMLNAKLPAPQKERLCLTGEAVTGELLTQMGLAIAAVAEDRFVDEVATYAQSLAKKDRATYAGIKRGLMRDLW